MSIAEVPKPSRRGFLNSLRSGRTLQVGAAAIVILAALIVLAILYGDLPEVLHVGGRVLRDVYRRNTFLPGFILLYLEESGIPLPAPGDVFVMYVGIHVPHHLAAWIAPWRALLAPRLLHATPSS